MVALSYRLSVHGKSLELRKLHKSRPRWQSLLGYLASRIGGAAHTSTASLTVSTVLTPLEKAQTCTVQEDSETPWSELLN